MKVTTEELERCELLMTVEVEPKQEQAILQKSAKRIAREVKIPGFRPGKAPYNVIVRRFGLEAVQQEALEQAADKLVQDALSESNIVPYARVSLEKIDWNPLTLQVKVPLKPKVELGDYRDIRLETEPVEVTDEDVEETLKNIQDQNASWVPVERASQIGDMITMSMVEKDGETVFNEQESVEHVLDPPEEHEGHDHPDMTTPLLDLSAGDEKTFTVTYPEEFSNKTYAGKDITFEVKVISVKEKEIEPLDDEFAQAMSDFETLDEFKADIRQRLLEQRQQEQNNKLGNEVVDKLAEEATVEWAQAFEDEQVETELRRYEQQMKSYGLTLENFYTIQNKTEEEFVEDVREQVVVQIKRSLILSKIIDLEKLDVGETEILERAKMIADYSGDDRIWRNIMASPTRQNMIANDLLVDKAIQRLALIARGEAPELAAETEATPEAAAEPAAVEETGGPAPVAAGEESVPANVEIVATEVPIEQPENDADEKSVTT